MLDRSHAAYYAALGDQGSLEIRSGGQHAWLMLLEREHDNLRAALEWLRQQSGTGEAEPGLLLAGQLHWFWHLKGHFSEGRTWLEQMRAASGKRETAGYATTLTGIGDIALAVGDYAAGRAALTESITIWRTLDDRAGLALALLWFGFSELFHGRVGGARASQREALELFNATDDRWGVAMAELGLGFDAAEANALDEARERFERALAIFRDLKDNWGVASALQQLAHLTYRSGDFATARAHVEEVLEIEQRMGDAWLEVQSHGLLGEIARASGDSATAARASSAGLEIATEMGNFALHAWILRDAGFVALEQGHIDEARAHLSRSVGLFRERDYPLGIACGLVGLAGVAAEQSDEALAAYLLGAAQAEMQRLGLSLAPADRLAGERITASIRQVLGDEAFEREWRRGSAAPLSEALEIMERQLS